LPVATLFLGKLIIDDVVLLLREPGTPAEWLAGGRLDWLGTLLLGEFALAVLADGLGRVVALLDSLLSERVTNASSVRLMEHAAALDLRISRMPGSRTSSNAPAGRPAAASP
jgi:ATP-binding cassette subfamily B protein